MKNILSFSSTVVRVGLFICFVLAGIAAKAQCYEDFYVYQVSPNGQLCSPGYATLRADYYNDYYGTPVSGEFRWYTSETSSYPVQTQYISDFGQMTSDYTLYANNGTTIWVSYYNYNTGCESYRSPYTFTISASAYLYQNYAERCGTGPAKIQLSSNVSGVTYQLYKLVENYDPWYGTTQEYQYQQSNSTGYFEIQYFDPADQDKYFAKVYQPYGCSQPYYYQLWFELTDATPPTITGNLTVAAGSSTTLNASGNAASFNWYNATGTLVGQGWQYTTPTTLSPNTYTYQVRGTNSTGTCLSDPASVTITVALPDVTYSPLYNNTNFTKTIDLSKPVGTVSSAASTTASGGVTYSIPIYASPGTNGLQPSVAVVYNSQGGNGNVGYGWNISGLSVISRSGKDVYHDGSVGPVSYTSTDAFLLDGIRLNPLTGANGANGTVYAGEVETFSKVVSFTNSSANNPDWFKVTAKDGTVMEFGHTQDSRFLTDDGQNVLMWRLNRIIDVNGNYIDFVYTNSFRDSRIETINYTGNLNTGLAPYNSITFSYKSRTDQITGYEAGASVLQKTLLEKIAVAAEGGTAKQYQFSYGFDNVHSFLKDVVEIGSDGTQLNSTSFLYGNQPVNLAVTQTTALTESSLDFYAGDFNGDGKTDLMAAKWYYNSNNPIRYHSKYDLLSDISTSSSTLLYTYTLPSNSSVKATEKKIQNFLTSDFNKDGRDDIAIVNTNLNGSLTEFSGVKINYTGSHNPSTGYTNYTTSANFAVPYVSNFYYSLSHQKGNFFLPGDFDGDGNQDYLLILGNARYGVLGAAEFKAFFTSPATGEVNLEITNFGFGTNSNPAFYAATVAAADMLNVLDVDGDGKMEILVTKDYQSYVLSIKRSTAVPGYSLVGSVLFSTAQVTKDSKVFPCDFNGDRKTDWLVKNANGTWNILYSTGQSFISTPFTFNQSVTLTGGTSDHKILVGDFNGDGKSDVLHGYPNGASASKLSLYYSRGGNTPFYYEQYDYSRALGLVVVGDFNGDGRSDFLNRNYIYDPADFVSLKPAGKERLLSKVVDGHNVSTSFEYKSLTDKTSYPYVYNRTVSLDDPANSNPYNYVELPMYVVSSVTSPDGIGGTSVTSYSYENAVVHRAAKGFLGFRKITAVNTPTGITSVTENDINTQFAVPYTTKQSTKITSTGELLSETTSANTFISLSTGSQDPKRFTQHVDKVLSVNYISGSATETTNTFDNYGNITTMVVKTGAPSGTAVDPTVTSTTTTSYVSIANVTPFPGKPDNITVSTTRTGMASQSSTTQFAYNLIGQVSSQTAFTGTSKAVTTSYTYNGFGNVLSTTLSATGLSNRASSISYDSKGRFALTKKVAAGTAIEQTETFTFDPKWGTPLTTVTSDCQTTLFDYDGFGRLKKTTYQEAGYNVQQSLNWDVQGETVYYSLTDYQGGKPDVKTWYDKLCRAVKTQTAGFNGQWLTQETAYDAKGDAVSQKSPYYSTETPVTTTTTYDTYNRVQAVTNPLTTTNYTYVKLSGGKMQVTITSAGQSKSQITDASGKVVSATDNGGQLDFTYDSYGNQVEVKHGTTVLISNTYDIYGRQTGLVDKNAGTISYQYNAFGQLIQQTDNAGNTYNMTYDVLGRLLTRQGPEGTTTYEYYKNGTCSNNDLVKVTGFNGVIKQYTYNNLQRLQSEKVTVDGTDYTTQYGYNTYGNLTSTTYPSGVIVNNTYDPSGTLLTVGSSSAGAPASLFNATAMNGYGQYTTYTLGDGRTSQHSYSYGMPQQYLTTGIQDLRFTFAMDKGNLTSRYDAVKGMTETFGYDNLNRLTSSSINGVQQQALTYDGSTSFSKGNIASKTDAGNYVYSNTKIHAVAYLTNPAGAQAPPSTIAQTQQQIGYTPFLKTSWVVENPYRVDFTYGPDYQRVKSVLQQNSATIDTRYYIGGYEKQITSTGTREIHYVSGGDGLCAIIVRENGINKFYSTYTDYLGSILTVTDAATGTVVAEQNFDAWGRNRNPQTWQYANVPAVPVWLYRGYTGHEHLPQFGLINMNGRMYDPVQGRMLSPDNFVSSPYGTQGYNRYSYGNNNPLSYVDPDGNIIVPIIVGAVVGAFFGGVQADMHGQSFWSGAWKGAIVGGIGGGLSLFGGGTFLANVAWGAGEGVLTNGISNLLNNNPFFQGAVSAALVGGAFAALTSGVEAYKNLKDGYGFGTNSGRLKKMLSEFNNSAGVNQMASAEKAIQFVQKRFGMTNVSMTFDANLSDYGITDANTGNIRIGPAAFTSGSYLKYTIAHEYGHSVYERILDAKGNFINWKYNESNWRIFSNSVLNEDGPLGYSMEILNSGRLHAGIGPLQFDNFLWKNYGLYHNMRYNDFLNFKWLYTLPKRFENNVIYKVW